MDAIRKRFGFLVHDVLAHPFCGVLWILGFNYLGDLLHDGTVFACNEQEEVWTGTVDCSFETDG